MRPSKQLSILLLATSKRVAFAFQTPHCYRGTTRRLFATTSANAIEEKLQSNNNRLFPEELNILYDSKCNVCKLEIGWLHRRDVRLHGVDQPKLKLTDLEEEDAVNGGRRGYDETDPANGGVSYEQGMKSIHGVTHDGKVLEGVPVFRLAYEQVGLGWLFSIYQIPILKRFLDTGYAIFAKYRTNLTRGASVETLLEAYEERKRLEQQQKQVENCEVCQTSQSSSSALSQSNMK